MTRRNKTNIWLLLLPCFLCMLPSCTASSHTRDIGPAAKEALRPSPLHLLRPCQPPEKASSEMTVAEAIQTTMQGAMELGKKQVLPHPWPTSEQIKKELTQAYLCCSKVIAPLPDRAFLEGESPSAPMFTRLQPLGGLSLEQAPTSTALSTPQRPYPFRHAADPLNANAPAGLEKSLGGCSLFSSFDKLIAATPALPDGPLLDWGVKREGEFGDPASLGSLSALDLSSGSLSKKDINGHEGNNPDSSASPPAFDLPTPRHDMWDNEPCFMDLCASNVGPATHPTPLEQPQPVSHCSLERTVASPLLTKRSGNTLLASKCKKPAREPRRGKRCKKADALEQGTGRGNKPIGYKCTYPRCKKVYEQLSLLEEHRKEHKGIKQCPCCSATFTSRTRFEDHMNQHNSLTPHQCKQCSKAFSSREVLARHIKRACKKQAKKGS